MEEKSSVMPEIMAMVKENRKIREMASKDKGVLKLKTHTVIVLVGASGSGKTHFCKKHLIPELQKHFVMPENTKSLNVQYISSDDIRRDLGAINEEVDYPYYMQNVSAQAFDLLYKKLELVLSWPVKAEFAIVDTTGLNKVFRDSITKIAKNNSYNTCVVVLLYEDRDEYFKYLEQGNYDGHLISGHITRLKRRVAQELTSRDFDTSFYFKTKNFEDFKLEIEDAELYKSCFLPWKNAGVVIEYPIIGDVHGDLKALQDLSVMELEGNINEGKVEFPPFRKPILLGDFVDKGAQIAETIEFLYENRDKYLFVLGNHENFVYKYLKNLIPEPNLAQEFIEEYFGTIQLLEKDPVLAEKFFKLWELSKPFYIGHNFIATHSPCKDQFLGKLDVHSQRMQRNFRLDRIGKTETPEAFEARLETSLGEIIKPYTAVNKPFHVWGHFAFKKVARCQNKVGIDTATSHGNRLTTAIVQSSMIFFKSVPSTNPVRDEYLPTIFGKKDAAVEILPEVDMEKLDEREIARIAYAARDKINFISGTMSPSDKNEKKGTLESIESCFNYYKSKEIFQLCLQPKYMGSRAEVYLCRDTEKSYSTTRKGYSCIRDGNREKLLAAYSKLYEKLKPFMDDYDFEWLVLDAELMPWYALGRGLIEKHYTPVAYGLESELALLEETGFEKKLQALFEEKETSGYNAMKGHSTKAELREKFGFKLGNYANVEGFRFIPIEKQKEYLEIYKEQLRLFASPSETLEFKPFSILKGIRSDGEETLFFDSKNSELWGIVAEDKCLVVDLTDFEKAVQEGERFYQEILDAKLEGVVVKPEEVYVPGVAPYMKVRSPFYLSIIYGWDYLEPKKLEKLVRQKRITRKLQTSIDEWEYGKRMLEIKRADISMQNKEYVSLFAKMIFEEKKEEKFDPRL